MNVLIVCMCIRSHGDATHCRKALHRAVQCTSDYPEHVCEVLLSFERVEGELDLEIKVHSVSIAAYVGVLTGVILHRFFRRLGWCSAENRDQTQQGERAEIKSKSTVHTVFLLCMNMYMHLQGIRQEETIGRNKALFSLRWLRKRLLLLDKRRRKLNRGGKARQIKKPRRRARKQTEPEINGKLKMNTRRNGERMQV